MMRDDKKFALKLSDQSKFIKAKPEPGRDFHRGQLHSLELVARWYAAEMAQSKTEFLRQCGL